LSLKHIFLVIVAPILGLLVLFAVLYFWELIDKLTFAKYKLNKEIREVSKQIKKNPEDFQYYMQRARLYSKKFLYDKQLADLNKAAELAPKRDDIFYKRGIYYCYRSMVPGVDNKKELLEKAVGDMTNALKVSRNNDFYLRTRAELYSHNDQYVNAISDIDLALKFCPPICQEQNLCFKGMLFMQLNQYDKALEAFQNALEVNPQVHSIYYDLAISQKDIGQWDREVLFDIAGERSYRRSWVMDFFYRMGHIHTELEKTSFDLALAKCYEETGKLDDAAKSYQKYLNHENTKPEKKRDKQKIEMVEDKISLMN